MTCTMYIPCISNNFRFYIQKNCRAYTLHMAYAMYMICLLIVYIDGIPKVNMEILHAGHRRGTSLHHKLFPPNAWMKLTNFHVLTSCLKDKLHQWFLVLYGEHIIPAMVHSYTPVLQRLIWHDRNGVAHPIMSNEAVVRVFRRLGCALSFTAVYDEHGKFAPAYCSEVQLLWIYLSYTKYMLHIN